MLLSHKTKVSLNNGYSNIIGHMCYAAYKLWNVGNYERMNYKELGLSEYPDWYYQKKCHKDDLWYKQLPSQTAQEVLKILDKSWKSFYVLQKTHGIENPKPPRFKQAPIVITYMQNAIVHEKDSDTIRLSLPKQLKLFMSETYGISDNYIYLKNMIFKNTDAIKQIKIYPPEGNKCDIIIIYEVEDVMPLSDNGRYLSIDLGLHNLMTCYDSTSGDTFIVGRKYLSICNYFNKEIARVQSQWSSLQNGKGVKFPKSSKHIQRIHKKKNNTINDYLHKVTRYIVSYCVKNQINTVVIGDITNIRKDNDLGNVTNQKLHSLPYAKIYIMLKYKLEMNGITLIKQNEAYTSQTSPLCESVTKESAKKNNRIKRGLYKDGDKVWNADCVGAYNILRVYLSNNSKNINLNPNEINNPYVVKVAV
ncbi:RNA-guided endonuclease InsQ/TnpB family protein [Eubacterium ruminantium]|uniref:Transposase, IS605 OrfB family, central region n=1 Tax=Eubacterium ruminantium TaxID=42322 RepID=A0A1T4KZ14_9FIRM|nr:RNA-guided endonuclease TnpB family protein [Eubacterium ruminantium]SCW42178.1 transposase, IS605 OrfB family, central region [Eubacterium ruminantium]SCW66845.1 transposase, IS605 OrfB family, central region [Eubacterium ruminantium]SCW68825.1 transposase, IS605 OrfB family, central region [Eubacterium ruminantium]SCW69943.1 transposase, IS605 OrfB family, central region [Eubacterium ruminantium]SDN19983.1 transposase, IS605 OrfB family, central region [Eubacterium ruminantium]